jgi:hypothetical protein
VSILLDAGPSLNFLAVGQQNVLIQVAASRSLQIAAPQRVDREVLGMARSPRFARTGVERTWNTLKAAGRLQILDDSLSGSRFTDAVGRVSGMPAAARVRDRRSLGEILVLAHASVYAQQGHDVFVLMDDGDGRRRARRERIWLDQHEGFGVLTVWSTGQLLRAAAGQPGWIAREQTWEEVYDQMRQFDDGLPPR